MIWSVCFKCTNLYISKCVCLSLSLSLLSSKPGVIFRVRLLFCLSYALPLLPPLSHSLNVYFIPQIYSKLSLGCSFCLFFYVPYKKGSGHTERVVEQICLPIIPSQLSLLFSVLCVIYKCTAPSLDVFYSVEYSSCVYTHSRLDRTP